MTYILQVTPFTETPEILIFAVILGIFLMVASRIWKQRVFDIFAVGVWLYLALNLYEETAIVITLAGLILYELYYTFIAKIDE